MTKEGKVRLRRLVSWLICLPLLYFASIGPACWIVNCRTVPVSSWQLNDFYRPITRAMRNNDGIASVVMWYTNLWAGFPCHWEQDENADWQWVDYIFLNGPTRCADDPRQ